MAQLGYFAFLTDLEREVRIRDLFTPRIFDWVWGGVSCSKQTGRSWRHSCELIIHPPSLDVVLKLERVSGLQGVTG